MKRPLASKRPIGPILNLRSTFNQSQAEPVFESDEDVRELAGTLVRRTPGEIRRAEFMGFFDTPSIFIDFFLPSKSPHTITRENFTSSLTAEADRGRISEMTIRFPAVKASIIPKDDLKEFVADSVPSFYRIRIVERDELPDELPELHPHIHYSATARDEIGPPVIDQAPKLNRGIRNWYNNLDDLVE